MRGTSGNSKDHQSFWDTPEILPSFRYSLDLLGITKLEKSDDPLLVPPVFYGIKRKNQNQLNRVVRRDLNVP